MATKQNKADAARERCNKFLAPIIEGTTGVFGARAKLEELLSKHTGKRVTRHLLARWLNGDPAKRQQPQLGSGLLLREIYDKHKAQITSPWDATERRRPRGANKPKQDERNK